MLGFTIYGLNINIRYRQLLTEIKNKYNYAVYMS